jgi:hypothetical protein
MLTDLYQLERSRHMKNQLIECNIDQIDAKHYQAEQLICPGKLDNSDQHIRSGTLDVKQPMCQEGTVIIDQHFRQETLDAKHPILRTREIKLIDQIRVDRIEQIEIHLCYSETIYHTDRPELTGINVIGSIYQSFIAIV